VSKTINRALRRSALSIALGFTLATVAGGAMAQSAAGSVFGKTQAGATITISNLDTGQSREITADSGGRFSATQLPTGNYRISSGGQSREVTVVVGTGTSVNFAEAAGATTLDTVEVVGNRINPIDVSSVESTTVFSQAQIQALPIARDITNVALLAPGTVQGDTGLGNLASFGGSSVAENGYYINGFDVTNLRSLLSYANLPFDAIGSQQIKTGGYGAEYGRSLGGVINLVTKRGTNEWTGGASVYWTPESLRESGKDVQNRDPLAIADGRNKYVYRSADDSSSFSANVYAGGPLIKDRLFFFGLVEVPHDTTDTFDTNSSSSTSDARPTGMMKLDWNINDSNLLELTAIRNRSFTRHKSYDSNERYSPSHDVLTDKYSEENGGDVFIGKYTGYLTDNFTVSAQAGHLKNIEAWRTTAPGGTDCPAAYDSRSGGLDYIGCWNINAFTVGDRSFGPDTDTRKAYRLDAEWALGDHLLRFGYDDETFESGHAGLQYSGGIYYRYYSDTRVRVRHYQTTSASYEVKNQAYYLEDNWQLSDNWLAYLGLRSESFDNRNAEGDSFVKADNNIAPRLGFSWDVNGDSTFKVYGNAGRYYIPVASNTNIRLSGGEVLTTQFFNYTGIDPVTGAPISLGSPQGPESVNGSLTPPDAGTVAVTDLKPMYQDEFILGAQWALSDWTVGVKGVHREVKNGMDDYCSHDAFARWAADNGHDNFDASSMASCFIMNPGRDVRLALDLEGDGNLTEVTVPKSYLALPEYKREYDALEFTVERPKQNGLFLQGSYTYAKSKGNIEGYVNSSLEQGDPGATQDFDNRLFEEGAYGPLPNDRRHTLKAFGSYDFGDQWAVSGNLLVQSGRPVNCQGYLPLEELSAGDQSDLGSYSASTFFCLEEGGTFEGENVQGSRTLKPRGSFGRTPTMTRFDLGVSYVPNWAEKRLELKMDVFNLFNLGRVTEYNETKELTRTVEADADVDPVTGVCTPHLDPRQDFNDCDSVEGEYVYSLDPNFLNDVNYQSPRYIRFSIRYKW
jgi:hypothetical protein